VMASVSDTITWSTTKIGGLNDTHMIKKETPRRSAAFQGR
jgi:hypothetical protein